MIEKMNQHLPRGRLRERLYMKEKSAGVVFDTMHKGKSGMKPVKKSNSASMFGAFVDQMKLLASDGDGGNDGISPVKRTSTGPGGGEELETGRTTRSQTRSRSNHPKENNSKFSNTQPTTTEFTTTTTTPLPTTLKRPHPDSENQQQGSPHPL